MQIYLYSEDRKLFIMTRPAFLDPLETQRAGEPVYAFPKNCTTVAPPPFSEGEVAIFNEDEKVWTVLEDHVGEKYYHKKTGKEIIIEEFGPVPSTYVKEKPVLIQDLIATKIEDLKKLHSEELLKKVTINKLVVSVEDRSKLLNFMEQFGNYRLLSFNNNEEDTVDVSKDEVQEAEKYLYLRKMLLERIKRKLLKDINSCTSKKKLASLTLIFDIEETLQELTKASIEEIDAFFAGE